MIHFRRSRINYESSSKDGEQPNISSASVRSTSIRNPYARLLDEPKFDDNDATDQAASYKSLPRNFSSSSNSSKWTLLDTEMAKDKGIQSYLFQMYEPGYINIFSFALIILVDAK